MSFPSHSLFSLAAIRMTDGSNSQAESLLAAARGGDSLALGKLFALHQNYIRLLALSQIRSRLRVRASASDIVQETFLNAHRGFAEFRGTTSAEFLQWLRRILKRRIQHAYQRHLAAQRRDIRREISIDAIGNWLDLSAARLESVLVDDGPTPATRVQNKEQSIQVADALAGLADDYRDVVMLRSIEGLEFAEVASRMGRSDGAVRMLWLRGIQKLKESLEPGEET